MFMVTIWYSTSVNATDMTHSSGSTEETTDVIFTTEENLNLSLINSQVRINQNIIMGWNFRQQTQEIGFKSLQRIL